MNATTPGAELSAALVVAQKAARAVAHDAVNQFHRYRYTSAEAIIEEARTALNAAGLTASLVSLTYRPAGNAGDLGERGMLDCVFRLEHASGQFRDASTQAAVIVEKGRPLDKALAGARTYSLGYYLRDLLLLPRTEEGADVDQRNDTRDPREASPPIVHRDTKPENAPQAPLSTVADYSRLIANAATKKDLVNVCHAFMRARHLSGGEVAALQGAAKERERQLQPAAAQ